MLNINYDLNPADVNGSLDTFYPTRQTKGHHLNRSEEAVTPISFTSSVTTPVVICVRDFFRDHCNHGNSFTGEGIFKK